MTTTRWMSKRRLVKLCETLRACPDGVKALKRSHGKDLGAISRAWIKRSDPGGYFGWFVGRTCSSVQAECTFLGCGICGLARPKGRDLTRRLKQLNNLAILKARELGV